MNEEENNPFRMGVSTSATATAEVAEQPVAGVPAASAALSSALATAAAGGVFGFALLLLPWNSFGAATFGGFFGIFIAGSVSLPTHLVVFSTVRLLQGPRLQRSAAGLAAATAGGLTGLLCTVWSISQSFGVLTSLIATLLGAGFAGYTVYFLPDRTADAAAVTSRWNDLASED